MGAFREDVRWMGSVAPAAGRLTGSRGRPVWCAEGGACHTQPVRPSLFEFAGGEPAILALAAAHHARCLADPELNHPFSHPGLDPQHVERLAAYWGEVMGGPPGYSGSCGGSHPMMLRMHAGNGDMSDLGRRFTDCFVRAADDAGLPDDPDFRAALRSYMEWAVGDVLSYEQPEDVPSELTIPRWSWDGLQIGAAPAREAPRPAFG